MSEEWLRDLAPLQTDWHKPFLEIAPYLIIVFKRSYEFDEANKNIRIITSPKVVALPVFSVCSDP